MDLESIPISSFLFNHHTDQQDFDKGVLSVTVFISLETGET